MVLSFFRKYLDYLIMFFQSVTHLYFLQSKFGTQFANIKNKAMQKYLKITKEVIILKRFLMPRVAHCSEGCLLKSWTRR